MLKAIIFDCDGVLVDTEHLKFLAWQHALKQHDVEYSVAEYIDVVGFDSKYILGKISEAKKVDLPESIIETKEAQYQELRKQGIPPIQTAIDFAKKLHELKVNHGYVLALASSDSKMNITSNLELMRISDCFGTVVSGADDLGSYSDPNGPNKPRPYIYQEAAKQLSVEPNQCIAIEDTAAGVEAASSAGMVVIAVPNEYTRTQDFSQADFIVESLDALTVEELVLHVGGLCD